MRSLFVMVYIGVALITSAMTLPLALQRCFDVASCARPSLEAFGWSAAWPLYWATQMG